MSLLTLAENDLALTLESSGDFGREIVLTNPAGQSATLSGQYGDISAIQPLEDEILVSGNLPHITLRIKSIRDAGLGDPEAQQDQTGKPWNITVTNQNGDAKRYAFQLTAPDRTLGVVTGILIGAVSG